MVQNYLLSKWRAEFLPVGFEFGMTAVDFLAGGASGLVLETVGILRGADRDSVTAGMIGLWRERRFLCGLGEDVPFCGELTRADYDRFLARGVSVRWTVYPAGREWRWTAALTLDDLREIQKRVPKLTAELEREAADGPDEIDDDFRTVRRYALPHAEKLSALISFFDPVPELNKEMPADSELPYTVLQTNMTLGETHTLMRRVAPFLDEISDKKNGSLSPHWMICGGQTEVQRRKRGMFAETVFRGRKFKIGCYRNQNEPAPVVWARLLGGVQNSPAYQLTAESAGSGGEIWPS